jgi:hypothetical protein
MSSPDTVRPMGDMVHFYLAKANFLQDMLLSMLVWYFVVVCNHFCSAFFSLKEAFSVS